MEHIINRSIEEQFNLVANEYDVNRRLFIPCFDDFYQSTTDFIVASIPQPQRVLDLGAGTGLLTTFWYQRLPMTRYVLVDIAEKMLDVARERFYGVENVTCQVMDYGVTLPDKEFDVIISALSIHHLEDTDKRDLFRRIYEKLPEGGVFVNYDQFCGDTETMDMLINRFWIEQLENSGLSDSDLASWRERKKLDRECSTSEEIDWLRVAGFKDVLSVYTNLKFSVLLAVK